MKASNGEQGIALERYYQFTLWLVPTIEKFPRSQKFLLGDRIQQLGLTVLELLIEATYTRDRRAILVRVNLALEKLRTLIRLAKDLRHLELQRYECAAALVRVLGRGSLTRLQRGNSFTIGQAETSR